MTMFPMTIGRRLLTLSFLLLAPTVCMAVDQVQILGPVKTSPVSGSTTTVQGVDAHDSPVTGKPVLSGVYSSTAIPTGVTLGDSVRLLGDGFGRMVVISGCPQNLGPTTTNITSGSSDTVIVSSPGASTSIYLIRGVATNAGSANVTLSLYEGSSGGTRKFKAEIPMEGGAAPIASSHSAWRLPANTQLVGKLSASGDVDVNVFEYCLGPSSP